MSHAPSVKVLIIGAAGCGKSSLVQRRSDGQLDFSSFTPVQSMMNYANFYEIINDCKVEVKVYEIPMGEHYLKVAASYAADMDAALLAFDATQAQESVGYLKQRVGAIFANDSQHCCSVKQLVGCKCDAFDDDGVDHEGQLRVDEAISCICNDAFPSLPVNMVSAKTGAGVTPLFHGVVGAVLQKRRLDQSRSVEPATRLKERGVTTSFRNSKRVSRLRDSFKSTVSQRLRRVESQL